MKYWISDRNDSPTGYPLDTLFDRILGMVNVPSNDISLFSLDGYGLTINAWARALENTHALHVPTESLRMILKSPNEWFYNLDAGLKLDDGNWVFFGLHDSSIMYLEGPASAVESVASMFDLVELEG